MDINLSNNLLSTKTLVFLNFSSILLKLRGEQKDRGMGEEQHKTKENQLIQPDIFQKIPVFADNIQ